MQMCYAAAARRNAAARDARVQELIRPPKVFPGMGPPLPNNQGQEAVAGEGLAPVLVAVGEVPPSCPATFQEVAALTRAQIDSICMEYNHDLGIVAADNVRSRREAVLRFLCGL
jgi:hypothetical protein